MNQAGNFYLPNKTMKRIFFGHIFCGRNNESIAVLRERCMNQLKTLLLLATLTALLLFVGQALAGRGGFMIALMFAGVMNFAAYWWSDKIVLRMYGAQEIDEAQAPDLFALVRQLAQRARIPMPRVYIIPQETPNAFATGRNPQHAAVAVTEGIMRL